MGGRREEGRWGEEKEESRVSTEGRERRKKEVGVGREGRRRRIEERRVSNE